MTIEWIFFDIGGPILEEVSLQEFWGRTFREACDAEGRPCDEALYAELTSVGIDAYAGSVTSFVAWRLSEGDEAVHRRILKRFWTAMNGIPFEEYRRLNPLREGVAEVIETLGARYHLGLVANQPARVDRLLEEYGVRRHFEFASISDVVGRAKPDIRLYEHALQESGVSPEAVVMVGDRIDNDMAPARAVGMWAVKLAVGRHARQQPRGPREAPHREITEMAALPAAVASIAAEATDAQAS